VAHFVSEERHVIHGKIGKAADYQLFTQRFLAHCWREAQKPDQGAQWSQAESSGAAQSSSSSSSTSSNKESYSCFGRNK
jgi:hypothetical protein